MLFLKLEAECPKFEQPREAEVACSRAELMINQENGGLQDHPKLFML
jgi:hypothetical protein